MSDDFKKFLKSHNLDPVAPLDEWQRIEASLRKKRTPRYLFAAATAAALILALSTTVNHSNGLSDEEAFEFMDSSYSYLDSADDTDESAEYLLLVE